MTFNMMFLQPFKLLKKTSHGPVIYDSFSPKKGEKTQTLTTLQKFELSIRKIP